ncbi:hypothetical protein [Bdellovibrio sp. HCB337]|uniref:hypothetical protein n=1 Tax=Bdellovibrio sp. HCB337 TaxID=3394358 RepID=UPI0039A52856
MKSAKLQSMLVFAILALMLTACSMEASIQSLVPDIKIFKAPGQAHGITSGSGQMKVTNTGTYKVSASVGIVGATNGANNSAVHTTSGGYKVYGTVQGAIVSQ